MYCLCYKESVGLYIDRCDILPSDGLIMEDNTPHVNKQFSAVVPNTDITIIVNSYLGLGGLGQLYANILYGSRYLLNFADINQLKNLSSKAGCISSFSVRPGEWYELFSKIINVYKAEISINKISDYFTQLNNLMDQDSIEFYSYERRTSRPTCWEGEFLVLLYFSDKIDNLIRFIPYSVVGERTDVNDLVVESCIHLVRNIMSKLDFSKLYSYDLRVKRMSDNIYEIFGYLRERGYHVNFLDTLQKTCKQSV